MIDLEARLGELGDLLDLPTDDLDLAGDLRGAGRRVRAGHIVLRVAVVVLVVAGVVAAVPTTRDAVAGWLGLDRVRVERRDDPAPIGPVELPGEPGPEGTPLVVDGRTIVVGAIDGRLNEVFVTKSIGGDGDVVSFDIDGDPALWFPNAHDLVVEVDGEPVVQRVAAATLLWQDDDVLRRIEGFGTLDDAVAFARDR